MNGLIIGSLALLGMFVAAARGENAPSVPQGPADAYESIAIRGHSSASQSSGTGSSPRRASDTGLSMTRVLTSLAVVLGVIFAMKYAGKRFLGLPSSGSGGGAIQVLARTMLGPKQQLVLVRLGGRVLLLSHGGNQVNTLTQIDDPEEVARIMGQLSRKPGPSFTSFFGRAHETYEEPQVEDQPEQELAEGMQAPAEPELASTRDEIGGLMEKVRSLSRAYSK